MVEKRKHEDPGWVLAVVDNPMEMIPDVEKRKHIEMTWSAYNGKNMFNLTIGKIEDLSAKINEDFNCDLKPVSVYRVRSPPFLNSVCAEIGPLIQNFNEMSLF